MKASEVIFIDAKLTPGITAQQIILEGVRRAGYEEGLTRGFFEGVVFASVVFSVVGLLILWRMP